MISLNQEPETALYSPLPPLSSDPGEIAFKSGTIVTIAIGLRDLTNAGGVDPPIVG